MSANFQEHRYHSSDRLSLYYREYGAGEDVVLCLHGLTRNSKDFHKLATHLAGRFRVLVPDVRGRGQSDRDRRPSRYNPGIYVRDVWALLEHAGVYRVTVIGTSMGGLMGMIMADQQAGRVRGLVLNDIGPEVPAEAVARIMQYAGKTPEMPDWDAAAAAARASYEVALPGMPDAFWSEYVRLGWRENAAGRPEPDVDPAVGAVIRHPPQAVRALQWLGRHKVVRRVAGVALDPWDAFRSVTMPCLVVHGALSDVLTFDIVERMQAVHPALDVAHVPDRGHTPLLNEPVALAAIDAFLDRVFGRQGSGRESG